MRTFKQGDHVTVSLAGSVSSVNKHHGTIAVNVRMQANDPNSYRIIVTPDRIINHTMAEPTAPETVVKVDGRIFLLDTTRTKGSARWISTRNIAYKWSELLTLGEIETIHESEDV